jgi:arylsulfatase A-like enzyme
MKRWFHSLCLSLVFVSAACGQESKPEVPRMLIISIDGLRPDCLLRADAPNLRKLMNVGSFSMWARTTDVAVTIPSHTSMLTGVTPEKHGIDFNGDPPDDATIKVPTLFDLAKARGLTTGLASGKRKFTLFAKSGHLDHIWTPIESVIDDASTAKQAVRIITDHQPDVMYVHLGATDATGHAIGWGTADQLQTISLADRALGQVLDAYREIGQLDNTFIIISSDHGGTVRTHGRDDVRSRYIPWIAVGSGVRSDYDLTRLGKDYDLSTFDTFATACHVLKIPLPPDLDGQPVLEMYVDAELLQPATPTPATQPSSQPATDRATTQPVP